MSPAVRGAYVTLNYVWGSTDSQQNSINPFALPKSVPQVIEDSISVAKMLKFRYIWVDRYCVPQDDEKAKQSQIELMGGLAGISHPMTAPPQGSSNGTRQAGTYSFAPIRAISRQTRLGMAVKRRASVG